MANTDDIEELLKPVVFPSTLRSYTVSYVSTASKTDKTPAIILRGQWLEKAHFPAGRKIEVRVMDECIVISAKNLEPTLEDTMFRIQQLSERKQQQIMEMIAMVENSKSTFS
ncbi:SymE family type I addiction module toxin [Lelliottia wanjuensis]|uniref:SymE family type I addiction module toxin n=1 Tax=Lelliottia wanjuensis TaxID=3050585 RepID=UPI00254E9574|nr:SymE family type I addiction module toxin [Lelliottia sp. V104_15]MDK9603712.1 SymE family type I addiction module toxin [Lelliottia sp. V104_15]